MRGSLSASRHQRKTPCHGGLTAPQPPLIVCATLPAGLEAARYKHDPNTIETAIMAPAPYLTDVFDRPMTNLRLSVTDRCNLRCQYCMPEEDYLWLPREDLLTF